MLVTPNMRLILSVATKPLAILCRHLFLRSSMSDTSRIPRLRTFTQSPQRPACQASRHPVQWRDSSPATQLSWSDCGDDRPLWVPSIFWRLTTGASLRTISGRCTTLMTTAPRTGTSMSLVKTKDIEANVVEEIQVSGLSLSRQLCTSMFSLAHAVAMCNPAQSPMELCYEAQAPCSMT